MANLLIVDDQPLMWEFLCDALSGNGSTCYSASNGQEALECIQSLKADEITLDLILTDIDMPVMDGVSMIYNLREGDHKDTPIIVASGSSGLRGTTPSLGDALEAGANITLEKPIRLKNLLHAVGQFIEL